MSNENSSGKKLFLLEPVLDLIILPKTVKIESL